MNNSENENLKSSEHNSVADRVRKYLNDDIWRVYDEPGNFKERMKDAAGKIYIAGRLFFQKDLLFYAASLAFNTVLAVVPLVALFFAVSRGFGYSGIMEDLVRSLLSSQPDAADYIIRFANSYLTNARSSAIIGFGVVVMLYSVFSLINNVETVFDSIWNVKESRGFTRKLMNYLSMFFMLPITIVIISGINIAVYAYIEKATSYEFLAPIVQTLIRLIPTVVMSVAFTVVYVSVPNTKVRIRTAIIPGILAAIFMQLLQQAYVIGQTFLTGYNAIYGSLAALPLFMLWVQFSWYIILYFAELNYTSQNHDFFELRMSKESLSDEKRLVVSAILLSLIFKRFRQGDNHYTAMEMKQETHLPLRLVQEILDDLCAVQILDMKNEKYGTMPTYYPYQDISNISLGTMVEKLISHDMTDKRLNLKPILNKKTLARIAQARDLFLGSLREMRIEEITRADN